MAYETRRERRLRREAEQRAAARTRLNAFFAAVLLIALFVFIVIYLSHQRIEFSGEKSTAKSTRQSFGANEANNKSAEQNVTPKAQEIIAALPNKITEINGNLGIKERSSLTNLPTNTSTAVVIIDVSDKGRGSANYNGSVQFTSASTYKLWVAYMMVRDVESGRRTWNSRINGTTWDNCFTKMIVNSDNVCPETYLSANGYDKLDQTVAKLGMSGQTVFTPGNMRTSASDLALILQKLYKGELMNEENKNKLYGLMSRQQFRQGIPTGVGDKAVVYDKIGWLDEIVNDAAIVHGGKGDYILVIMTNGESWQYVAQLAAWINTEMNK